MSASQIKKKARLVRLFSHSFLLRCYAATPTKGGRMSIKAHCLPSLLQLLLLLQYLPLIFPILLIYILIIKEKVKKGSGAVPV